MKKTESLLDYIINISQISCEKCHVNYSCDMDEMDASEHCYNLGWRFQNGKVKCPTCSKEKNKKNEL